MTMKARNWSRFFLSMTAFIAVIIINTVTVIAQQDNIQEHIQQYSSIIAVQKNNTINVTETIQYVFPDGQQKHGIYRIIPLKGITISNISVVDENNTKYLFTASRSGGEETIKIGDADTLVTGTHNYILQYVVSGAITNYKDFDEIYWNAIGDQWSYPITSSHQTIILPAIVGKDALKIACYKGALGSTTTCNDLVTITTTTTTQIDFNHSDSLASNEGITIAAGFPKGVVTELTAWQRFVHALKNNIELIIALIILLSSIVYSIKSWLKNGRDGKRLGIIVAQYDVPEGMHPSEVYGLLHKNVANSAIAAELINLAVKGYVKIEKFETKILLFTSDDYRLTLLIDNKNIGDTLDGALLSGLFGANTHAREVVLLSDLKGTFYTTVAKVKKAVFSLLVGKNYFTKDPSSVRAVAVATGVIGIIASIFIGIYAFNYFNDIYVLPVLILAVIICAVTKYRSAARTVKGVEIKEYILGLKEYLQIAEKDRINFHNAPDKKPELFEALLPYAMVLGVEKAWAKEFEGIYTTPPNWYVDPTMNGFNTGLLVGSFSNFNSVATSSFVAPSSSGSGSGGGGFSGGGSGGGGGGSW
ncbi:MAG: DUF2207 domain-containing protein [Candidatus Paceibacterota bacterium]